MVAWLALLASFKGFKENVVMYTLRYSIGAAPIIRNRVLSCCVLNSDNVYATNKTTCKTY